MVDDFDRDLAAGGPFKGVALGRIQRGPGGLVDFGAQGALELFVRLVGAGEVGVADEETFFVVVGVDEPARDVVGSIGPDGAGGGVVDVQAPDLDGQPAAFARLD